MPAEMRPGVLGRPLVLGAALLAMVLKLYCAATTFGSGDVLLIARYGRAIAEQGMGALYQTVQLFNHPPVTGSFFGLLYESSAALDPHGFMGVPRFLPLMLRIPDILCDFVATLILLQLHLRTGRPPLWALVVFALSPAAFMVSGFHGNVDPIMVCLTLLAAYFCVEEQVFLSAVCLGLACNIKVVPLLLVPVFAFFWLHRSRRHAWQFLLVFAGACLLGWSSALIESPTYFVRNVLGYPSFSGAWGVTFGIAYVSDALHLAQQGRSPFAHLALLLTALKGAIIGLVVALAWLRRKENGLGVAVSIALAYTAFVVLAPGFLPYYLIWMAPFVLLYSARWYLALTVATSAYLFAYYDIASHGMPWFYADLNVPPAWVWWGIAPWLVAAAMGIVALDRWRRTTFSSRPPVG